MQFVTLLIAVGAGCSSNSPIEHVDDDGVDDNCPFDANPEQADGNGIGDTCEPCDAVTLLASDFTEDLNQFTVLNDVSTSMQEMNRMNWKRCSDTSPH